MIVAAVSVVGNTEALKVESRRLRPHAHNARIS
jgi:hypothetical protein